jgi:CS domain
MSKLSDYGKFDHLDESGNEAQAATEAQATVEPQPTALSVGYTRDSATRRWQLHAANGSLEYEWEQTLSEVIVYVQTQGKIKCTIHPSYIDLQSSTLTWNKSNASLVHPVLTSESTWTREENTSVIYLHKANKAIVWENVFADSPCLNPMQVEETKQDLMRERWSEEHAGFDFSQASFNGRAPDPRDFMGGVKW